MVLRSVTFLLAVLAAVICMGGNDVYKTVDEEGNVTYTDSPPQNEKAEKIELKNINTIPSVDVRQSTSQTASPTPSGQYHPRILTPPDGYQMGPSEKSLTIEAATDRPLDEDLFFQLLVNGEIHGTPSASGSLVLSNIRRGTKQISIAVIDQQGNNIELSPSITIHVVRPNPKK